MASEFGASEEGAALIEAALVLPILLLLIFGIMEISLYVWDRGLAGKAVQLGARRAVLSDSVAVGPGLDVAESPTYWDGLPPGASCFPAAGERSPCPAFSVVCDAKSGCRCPNGPCSFRFEASRLTPILKAMQAVMPDLRPDNIEISYTTNGLGYVARPVPVPVDVRLSLIGVHYTPLLLADVLGRSLPLRASAQLASESLRSLR